MSLRLKSLGAAGNDSNFESSVDNIAKHLIICMFCKLFKNIFPFSEIIFLLLHFSMIGTLLLYVALIFTIYSGYDYFKGARFLFKDTFK